MKHTVGYRSSAGLPLSPQDVFIVIKEILSGNLHEWNKCVILTLSHRSHCLHVNSNCYGPIH